MIYTKSMFSVTKEAFVDCQLKKKKKKSNIYTVPM